LALSTAGLLSGCVYGEGRSARPPRTTTAPPPATTDVPPRRETVEEDLPPRPGTPPPAGKEDVGESERPATRERTDEPGRRPPNGTGPRVPERREARRPETPPATAVPPRPPPTGKFYVEAGAYSDRQRAERERRTLDDLGTVKVTETKRSGRSFYRVWIGPVGNAEQGDRLLARVVRRGYNEARVIAE
jgi:cell division protein FtsN